MVPSGTTTKYERSRGRCFVFNEIAGFFRRSKGTLFWFGSRNLQVQRISGIEFDKENTW
jgi:hypothetical protein